MTNWLVDTNRFQLAGPPTWFLSKLWEFDPSLVIVPSRQNHFYRLAQRRPTTLSTAIVNDVMKEQADTAMLVAYGLVPVTTILSTVRWDNPAIFEELRRRAPWRMGGAEKFSAIIDEQEQKEALDKAAQQEDMLNYVSKDAWRFYNKQIGTRSHLWSPTAKSSNGKSASPGIVIPKTQYSPLVDTGWGNVLRPRDRS